MTRSNERMSRLHGTKSGAEDRAIQVSQGVRAAVLATEPYASSLSVLATTPNRRREAREA
jgi:hypothetical protein